MDEALAVVSLRHASLSHLGFCFSEDVGEGIMLKMVCAFRKSTMVIRKRSSQDNLSYWTVMREAFCCHFCAYDIRANLLKCESGVFPTKYSSKGDR